MAPAQRAGAGSNEPAGTQAWVAVTGLCARALARSGRASRGHRAMPPPRFRASAVFVIR